MSTQGILLLISAIAGVFLLASTMLLVGLRRIYFDAVTKQPITFEIPIFGKVKTQAPAFALIVVAAFLVVYPITRAHADQAILQGDIDTAGRPVTVTVVAVPYYQSTLQNSEHLTLSVPLIQDARYRVQYIVENQIVWEQEATLKGRDFAPLKTFAWRPAPQGTSSPAPTRKDISDDDLRRLGIIQ